MGYPLVIPLDLSRSSASLIALLLRVRDRFPNDFLPLERLDEAAASGEIQVFPLPDAVIVGQMRQDGTAHILAAAGNLLQIMGFEPELRRWYAEAGASRMTLAGRKGWAKALAPRGWKPTGGEHNELGCQLRTDGAIILEADASDTEGEL